MGNEGTVGKYGHRLISIPKEDTSTTAPELNSPATTEFRPVEPGDRWRCIRCGKCCRKVFDDRWLDFIGLSEWTEGMERCPHLREEACGAYCDNYPSRPNACRTFPFTLRKVEGGAHRLHVHAGCPGFGRGRVIAIRRRIILCVRHSNREFQRRLRIDFSDLEERGTVRLIGL